MSKEVSKTVQAVIVGEDIVALVPSSDGRVLSIQSSKQTSFAVPITKEGLSLLQAGIAEIQARLNIQPKAKRKRRTPAEMEAARLAEAQLRLDKAEGRISE